MLTQGPASDLKCQLIILSFLTLSNLLDCLIFTSNTISVVFLLLQLMRYWGGGGGGGGGVKDLY